MTFQYPLQPVNREGIRHTDCPFYGKCLTYAVKHMWEYWSCGKCKNHTLSQVYERQQYIAQYYSMLVQIYPEFRRKYERFMETYG